MSLWDDTIERYKDRSVPWRLWMAAILWSIFVFNVFVLTVVVPILFIAMCVKFAIGTMMLAASKAYNLGRRGQ